MAVFHSFFIFICARAHFLQSVNSFFIQDVATVAVGKPWTWQVKQSATTKTRGSLRRSPVNLTRPKRSRSEPLQGSSA